MIDYDAYSIAILHSEVFTRRSDLESDPEAGELFSPVRVRGERG
jgi:hypothetical protein